jgi:hypothetical protein
MTSVQRQLGRNGSRHDIQEPLGATVPGATYKDREDVHARHEFSLASGSLGGVCVTCGSSSVLEVGLISGDTSADGLMWTLKCSTCLATPDPVLEGLS